MALQLITAPHPIFSQKAKPVMQFDDALKDEVAAMFALMYRHKGVGLGANMAGLLKQIIVVDLQNGGPQGAFAMINPDITQISEERQSFREGSLSFPGIAAEIERPARITVTYADTDGQAHEMKAEGWLAQVIQHEIDYLHGITFLDHLSPLKKRMLLKKTKKAAR